MSFLLSSLAGLSTLIGMAFIFIRAKKQSLIIAIALSFAAGVMSFLSIIDLLPEAFSYIRDTFLPIPAILLLIFFFWIGILISILLDKLIPTSSVSLFRLGILSMLAIMLHNIPEGMATFITTTHNFSLGLRLTLAIACHNIPEGISIAVPIYYATGSKRKAFFYTFVSAISEPFGAFLAYLFFPQVETTFFLGMLFSFIAGIMLHIALFELLPKAFSYSYRKISVCALSIGILFVLFCHLFLH